MKVSARNQFAGVVSIVASGAVNDEVELTLDGGEKLTAIVTKASVQSLGLAVGKKAIAIIKAPLIILATPNCGLNFSARNQISGKISKIDKGSVNSSVTLNTTNGLEVSVIVTNDSVSEMSLTEGDDIIALIKASSIILATEK